MYCEVIYVQFGDEAQITGRELLERDCFLKALERYREAIPSMDQHERAAALREMSATYER